MFFFCKEGQGCIFHDNWMCYEKKFYSLLLSNFETTWIITKLQPLKQFFCIIYKNYYYNEIHVICCFKINSLKHWNTSSQKKFIKDIHIEEHCKINGLFTHSFNINVSYPMKDKLPSHT
jgi:hypothetical protein